MERNFRATLVLCLLVSVVSNTRCLGQSLARTTQSVSVKLTPASGTIGTGANQQLNAAVTGSTNRAVTWTVNGVVNGTSTYGTVDPTTQLYFAPAAVPNPAKFTITATSVADTTKSASATLEVLSADPLGTVNSVKTIACPSGGVPGAICQEMAIACEGVSNWNAYTKVNAPPTGATNGVVIYGVGTGGSGLYDSQFTYGKTAVENVLSAGFVTVQVSFGSPFTANAPNGWLTGPGGVRRLACRYATLANWVNTKVLKSSTKPLCATGNSGGSAAISYALSNYGLDRIFSMVELTSGPPMSRIDYGCLCKQGTASTPCGQGQVNYCYGVADGIIDPAYNQPICTNAVNGNPSPIAAELFLSDSISSPGAVLAFPKTNVNVLYGGQDNSSAVPLGLEWYNQINSRKSQSCVADAPHSIPDAQDGATQIANDLINLCKLQP